MDYQSGLRLRQFKKSLEQFSDVNGGIELEHVPAFHDTIHSKIKLLYIKEGLEMLNKSELEAIESFLEDNGWELVNKWLVKMTNVQQPCDIRTAYEIQKLIFHMMSKWLNKSGNVLPEETADIVRLYNSKSKAAQKIIDDFRSKWAIRSPTDPDAQPEAHEQASVLYSNNSYQITRWLRERKSELQSAARRKQPEESTPQSKRLVTEEKLIPVASGAQVDVSQPSKSKGDDLEIIHEKGVFSSNGSTQVNLSKPIIIHESDKKNTIDLSRAEDACAFLRSLIGKNDAATDSGNEDAEKKSRQPIIINLPGSIQNNYFVI